MQCFKAGRCCFAACPAPFSTKEAAAEKPWVHNKDLNSPIVATSSSSPADSEDGSEVAAQKERSKRKPAPKAQNFSFRQQLLGNKPTVDAAADPAVLYPYIVQHGRGILSLSTLQEGLQHFVLPGIGYIAYAMMHNGPDFLKFLTPVALGDPICTTEQFAAMAGAFLERYPKAMFMQVSADFAAVLHSFGMLINSVGGETVLDLTTYTFAGYAKRGLRSAIASAVKAGVVVEEVMAAPVTSQDILAGSSSSTADWNTLVSEMKEVDREWVSQKGKHAGRLWFINRQPLFAPEPGVVKLAARDGAGRLLGFIFFDAVYESDAVVGYYANVTRMRPDAHPGTLNLIMSHFMDRIRAESQLSAPIKKASVKKSQKEKLEQQIAATATAAAATAIGAASSTPADATAAAGTNKAGVRFLSLGLSPLHQMDDSRFPHSAKVCHDFEFAYNHGSGYYPFKPLAAAKAKYGAGLHGGKHEDPSVMYKQVYLAHSHHKPTAAFVAMLDLGKTIGLWNHPADAGVTFLKQKIKDATEKWKQDSLPCSRGGSNKTGKGSNSAGPAAAGSGGPASKGSKAASGLAVAATAAAGAAPAARPAKMSAAATPSATANSPAPVHLQRIGQLESEASMIPTALALQLSLAGNPSLSGTPSLASSPRTLGRTPCANSSDDNSMIFASDAAAAAAPVM